MILTLMILTLVRLTNCRKFNVLDLVSLIFSTPALLMRMSIPPNRALAFSVADLVAEGSLRSTGSILSEEERHMNHDKLCLLGKNQ